ncbi:MAG: hypothetical protein OXE53_00910 [Deltaproteobacteria bacterium]|nr:hypothetical protein [Deltaproteobacteria bacterium]
MCTRFEVTKRPRAARNRKGVLVMGVGDIAMGRMDVRHMVGHFLCGGVLLVATTVLAPAFAGATVDCTFSKAELRSVCTSDTDGDTVTRDSFDDFPEPDDDAWVVIDVNDDEVDVFDVHVHFDDDHVVPLRWEIVGDLDRFRLSLENLDDLDVFVELTGDVHHPPERTGDTVWIGNRSDPGHTGRIEGVNSGSIISVAESADGLLVVNDSEHRDAVASAVNRGTIETSGNRARGLAARMTNALGTVMVTNETGATVTTRGDAARGASAVADTTIAKKAGTAIAINRGSILTTGNDTGTNRSYGLYAKIENDGELLPAELVDAVARAENSGTVETRGIGGRGVQARVEDGAGVAVAINRGSVTTKGDPSEAGFAAHGVEARSDARGPDEGTTQAVSGTAQAINELGGTILTTGLGAMGLAARGDTAIATNHGTITTTGDAWKERTTYGLRADGFSALARNEARAVNHGTIDTSGLRARGMQADVHGSGTATAINEGTVTTAGAGSTGLRALAEDSTALAINRGDISVLGSTAGISAYTAGVGEASILVDGGTVKAPYVATTADEFSGIGIFGGTVAGMITARIQGNSLIEAPTAARFRGGPADVIVDGSTIMGAIRFDQFNDTLSVIDSTITGDIDFGGGADTLVTQSSVFDGAITGVSEMFKRGSGVARFNGDVNFAGSSATIEDGILMFAGDFNLGSDGTMTIHDGARVAAVLTGENKDDPPQIIAGGGIMAQDGQGNPAALEIYLQADETVDQATRADQATLQQMAQNVIAEGTPITTVGSEVAIKSERQGGGSATIGSIAVMADGSRGAAVVQSGAVLQSPEEGTDKASCTPPTAVGASAGGTLLLTAMLSAGEGLFDHEGSHFADAENGAGHGQASFGGLLAFPGSGWRVAQRTSAGGHGDWTRAVTGKAPAWTGPVSTAGFDARFGRKLSIDVSASHDRSTSLRDEGTAGRLDGGRYVLRGLWRGETLAAGASIGRGVWRGRTAFANPVAGGALAGAFDINLTHSQAGVAARFDLGGMWLQPSATLFSGVVERDAYRARGATFHAAVPETTQRYHGWKAGMRLLPADWLSATRTVRWRPAVDLNAIRTHGDAATFTLQQSARKRLLSFSSEVRADAMPRTVLAVGVSVDAVASEQWRIRVGYAGMLIDGKPEHGVGAGLQVHF